MPKPTAYCLKCSGELDTAGACTQCPQQSETATHSLTATALASEAGRSFGPYRTLRILGEGGMGIVYLAEQREPIHRRVAVKVIKHGLDSREVIARFESERQALALMDHPNIARVLDAGTTEAGVPYFVMEYVPGMPLTEYCDRHRLNTRQRLELFCEVCHAIHHAHQKGVIHRDVKPSNVLVEMVDGKPLPKVIDFGVAKAVHQRLTERTLFTQMGMLVGTPSYMSPEQAGTTDQEVDTTTDIYSLGVVLYELLVGAVPFDPTEMRRLGFAEIVRIIREVEPPKPSDRLRASGARASDVAKLRATDLQILHRQLRGDLEWITMKALEKDRTRRYASASEFAADVVRHLRDEPVMASPPDPVYRLRKFTRRHKGPIAAGIAVLVSILAGLAISSLLYVRSERQRAEALRMNYVANLEAANLALRLADVPTAQNRLARCDSSLRGWEWFHLWRRCDPSLATLYTDSLFRGFTESGFAFSRDRQRVYWGLGDAVHVWDTSKYEPIQIYGGFGTLIAISADGSEGLTMKRPGTLNLVDLPAGTVRSTLDLSAAPDRLQDAALSPSGGQIAIGTVHGRVRVWDAALARYVLDVQLAANPADSASKIVGLSLQLDGRRIAALSYGGSLCIWDIRTARRLMQSNLPDSSTFANTLEVSPDGTRIAVGRGSTLRVMDVTSGKAVLNLPGHLGFVQAVKYSPDGSLIASMARDDPAVRLWNSSSGELIATFPGHSGVRGSLAFTPDGRQLFAGSSYGEARVWDVPSLGGELLKRTAHEYSSIAVSPDGSRMAVAQPGAAEVWDVSSGAKLLSWKTNTDKLCYGGACFTSTYLNYDCVAYSPDGSRIATGSRDGSVGLWDSRSGAEILVLRGHASAVTAVAFDPSGNHLASGSWDQTAIVWDLRSGKPVNRMALAASVASLVFAPGGDRLLIACGNRLHPARPDSLVSLWQPLSGRAPVSQFHLPSTVSVTRAAGLSNDGNLIAAISPAGVFAWDTTSGKLLSSAYASESTEPTAVAFSPDGSRLACGTVNGGLRMFDRSGNELLSLPGHVSPLRTVAFSPDGKRIYSCDDSEVRIWETRSAYFPGAAELVNSLREKFVRWSDVSSRIEGDRSMEPGLRQAALDLARRRGDDIGRWARETRKILGEPNRTAEEYRVALESASAALKAYPWYPNLLTTLGSAQYRTGRYREALESLQRSESLRGYPDEIDLILIAMVHYKLGETAQARSELQTAVPIRSHMADVKTAFLDEADALITPPGKAH